MTHAMSFLLMMLLAVHTARGDGEILPLRGEDTLRHELPRLRANTTLKFQVDGFESEHALLAEVHLPAFPRSHSNRVRALLSISSGNASRSDKRAFRRGQSVLFVALSVPALANTTITLLVGPVNDDTGEAVLFMRRESSMAAACPGKVPPGVRTCNGRGQCRTTADGARCDCRRGVYGDLCTEQLRAAPRPTQRPEWDGEVSVLPESAVVRLREEDNYAFTWRGSGSAFARARVLEGGLENEEEVVGGEEGEVGMACGRREGELPSVGRGGATVSVVRQEGSVALLELVCQTEREVRRGEWVVALWTNGGGATVSVQVRECGGDAEECPLQRDGFAWGLVVAAVTVTLVVVAVVVGLVTAVRMRRRRSEERARSDAWEWQRIGIIRVPSRRRVHQQPGDAPRK